MAVRVADSLKQQNDLKTFPVAYSEDIWIDKNKGEGEKDYADLQELYNEGALGGSGLPEPESKDKLLVSTENEETSELEWKQVDKSTVGNIPFVGTHDEWDALTDEEKAQYETVIFTDDTSSGLIDDNKISSNSTWSSEKINDSLVDINVNLGEIGNNIATIETSGVCEESRCVKIGNCVFFTIYSVDGYSFNVGWNGNVATFPYGFRPSKDMRYTAMTMREANMFGDFEITPNGTCRLYTTNATSRQALMVSGMFFVD